MTIQTLAEVLEQIFALPWGHSLYLKAERPWRPDSLCAVLEPDDEDPDGDRPFAKEHDLRYVLTVHDAQQIVWNVTEQNTAAKTSDLVEAFNFYYDNDAFYPVVMKARSASSAGGGGGGGSR